MSFGKLVSSEVDSMYVRVEVYHNCDPRNDQATLHAPKMTNPRFVRSLHGSKHWYFRKVLIRTRLLMLYLSVMKSFLWSYVIAP
jgi:hypothetical protein